MDEKHKVSVPQINRYKIISWTKHVYNCINTLQSKGSLKNIRVKDFKIKNDTPIITIFFRDIKNRRNKLVTRRGYGSYSRLREEGRDLSRDTESTRSRKRTSR
ncbi:unnamed protein product [Meganyctiphanes norvegica]|uniref:Uncharacterized protein n=1 Tax=Meganyctiphanes norvegica TaxID=48144 RepID=A0AAV2QN49_MEGNR